MIEPAPGMEGFYNYITPVGDLHEDRLAYSDTMTGTTIYVYDTAANAEVFSFDVEDVVSSIAFSPDGTTIFTGDVNGNILKWDAATGEALGQIGRVPGSVNSLVLNPDATRLYSAGSDGVVRVWGLE